MILLNSLFLSTSQSLHAPLNDTEKQNIPDALSFINFLKNSSGDKNSLELGNPISPYETLTEENSPATKDNVSVQQLTLRENNFQLSADSLKEIINVSVIDEKLLNTEQVKIMRDLVTQKTFTKDFVLTADPLIVDTNQLKEIVEFFTSNENQNIFSSNNEKNVLISTDDLIVNTVEKLKSENKTLLIPVKNNSLEIIANENKLTDTTSYELPKEFYLKVDDSKTNEFINEAAIESKISNIEKPVTLSPSKEETVFIAINKDPVRENNFVINLLLNISEKEISDDKPPHNVITDNNELIPGVIQQNLSEKVIDKITSPDSDKSNNVLADLNNDTIEEAEQINASVTKENLKDIQATISSSNVVGAESNEEELVTSFVKVKKHYHFTAPLKANSEQTEIPKQTFENKINPVSPETQSNQPHNLEVKHENKNDNQVKTNIPVNRLNVVLQDKTAEKYEGSLSQYLKDHKPKQLELIFTSKPVNSEKELSLNNTEGKTQNNFVDSKVNEITGKTNNITGTINLQTVEVKQGKPVNTDLNSSLNLNQKTDFKTGVINDESVVRENTLKSSFKTEIKIEQNIGRTEILKENLQPESSKQEIKGIEKRTVDFSPKEIIGQSIKIIRPEITSKEEPVRMILQINVSDKPKPVEVNFASTEVNIKSKHANIDSANMFVNRSVAEENVFQPVKQQPELRKSSYTNQIISNEQTNKNNPVTQIKFSEKEHLFVSRISQEEIRNTQAVPLAKNNEQTIFQNHNPELVKDFIYNGEKIAYSNIINENASESVKFISSFIHKPELKREIEQIKSSSEKTSAFNNVVQHQTAKSFYDELKSSIKTSDNKENTYKIIGEKFITDTEANVNTKSSPDLDQTELLKQTQQKVEQPETNKNIAEKTATATENPSQKIKISDQIEWNTNENKIENVVSREKLTAASKPFIKEYIKQVKSAEVMKEISQFVQKKEDASLILRITPAELGSLKISIKMMDQLVKAEIEVESEQIKNIVETNVNQLRDTLQANGVQLSSLTISLSSYDQKNQKPFFSKKKQHSENSTKEVSENKESVEKKMGYNTYDYVV